MKNVTQEWLWLAAATVLSILVGVGAGQWWRDARARPVVESLTPDVIDETRLVMFATSSCPVCAEARQWLDEHRIDYVEHRLDASEQARALARKLEVDIVPTFAIGSVRINGFARSELSSYLQLPSSATPAANAPSAAAVAREGARRAI
jgi:glutaredoxin